MHFQYPIIHDASGRDRTLSFWFPILICCVLSLRHADWYSANLSQTRTTVFALLSSRIMRGMCYVLENHFEWIKPELIGETDMPDQYY